MSEEEKIKGTAGQELKTTACKKEKYTLKGKKGDRVVTLQRGMFSLSTRRKKSNLKLQEK